ncbi:MAG: DUF2867 domain-containing protein, partial [Candidatus Krumholzibacteria bacterium]|nr:DUF2867 domain-containing protein [Candidatus Krumholzibacteria bacterium]
MNDSESGITTAAAGVDESLFCSDLPTVPDRGAGTILVTGARGYIGGRLVPELLARGYRVRRMVRGHARGFGDAPPGAEDVIADALDPGSLDRALEGVDVAYYLIHSMRLGPREFAEADARAAANFRGAAARAGVRRIIYLGGLGDVRSELSRHLRSRMEVARELQAGPVPATILRAAIIIGSGSASYEIIKNLVLRFPVILVPRWVRSRCQPVSIRDVIKYLVGSLETPETAGGSYDIGGNEVMTYREMMETVAGVLGRRRLFVFFPLASLRMFAYAASLLTPVPAPITISLLGGLKNDVICEDDRIRRLIPFEPISFRESLARALTREEQDRVHTRWSDAYPPARELAMTLDEMRGLPGYSAHYSIETDRGAPSLFASICRIGGREGWFHGNWMWRLRGEFDRVIMGVGTRRGRKRAGALREHDVVDFWRVEKIRPDRRLLLRAEMRLTGKAWL